MTTPHALRDLATLIENLDDAGVSIGDVETPGRTLVDGQTIRATLSARIELQSLESVDGTVLITLPDGTEVRDDDADSQLEIPLSVEIDADGGSVETDASPEASTPQLTDGGVALPPESDRTSAGTNETKSDSGRPADVDEEDTLETADDGDSKSESGTEPYKDPARLREVYDAHETFSEMTDALGVTVTPQTVRHHMIKHGIHQPMGKRGPASTCQEAAVDDSERESDVTGGAKDSNSTIGASSTKSEDRSSESTVESTTDDVGTEAPSDEDTGSEAAADSDDLSVEVDLPDHVTLDDVKVAVTEATTLFEVQRDLRVDRSTARRVLGDLDLLDFVGGRVDAADGRREPMEVIDERIRRACS